MSYFLNVDLSEINGATALDAADPSLDPCEVLCRAEEEQEDDRDACPPQIDARAMVNVICWLLHGRRSKTQCHKKVLLLAAMQTNPTASIRLLSSMTQLPASTVARMHRELRSLMR